MSDNNQKIKESKCFGFAYDKDAPECKICEVANLCAQRVMNGVKKPTPSPTVKKNTAAENTSDTMKPETTRPEPQKEATKPTKKKESKKSSKNYDPSMPDFKAMSNEDLDKLAVERGLDLEGFNYSNVSIRRMRLTMAIKKTYEV